jgi:hypothetical protein
MRIVQAPRASTIIYSLLVNQRDRSPWLLPANICPIVPITFFKARVPFQFVDISARTLHMDLDRTEALLRKRKFGGLLYSHTYGETSTPNDFFESMKLNFPDLLIIDDRCLCIPELVFDPANKADVQLYSTGYAKVVELNFGGFAFMQDDVDCRGTDLHFNPKHHEEIEKSYKAAIRQRSRFFYRDSDWLETSTPVPAWDKYVERIQRKLLESLEKRLSLNQIYSGSLPAEVQFPGGFQNWRFNIRVRYQQHILEQIFSAGLFASSHYASLAGIMDDGKAPEAESLAQSVINLFNDHHFTADQAEQVCRIIRENLS